MKKFDILAKVVPLPDALVGVEVRVFDTTVRFLENLSAIEFGPPTFN